MFCLPTATRDLMQHQIVVSDSLWSLGKTTKSFQAVDINSGMNFRECLNENNQRLRLFLAGQ
jgi:hypothetical protein